MPQSTISPGVKLPLFQNACCLMMCVGGNTLPAKEKSLSTGYPVFKIMYSSGKNYWCRVLVIYRLKGISDAHVIPIN